MQVDYSKNFLKQYAKLTDRLQQQTDDRIELWQKNPADTRLHDHPLTGKYQGYRSINVTGDLRALYAKRGSTIVIFGFIGTHSQLYG